MTHAVKICLRVALVAVALTGSANALESAQPDRSTDRKTDRSWATVMSWPDLTVGMWQMKRGSPPTQSSPPSSVQSSTQSAQQGAGGSGNGPPLIAEVRTRAAASAEARAQAQGFTPCAPFSPFDMLGAGHPLKFFYTQGEILIMSDGDNLAVRRIFMDGGAHDSIDPSYAGRSFGQWQGRTLVIETSGFDALARLSVGVAATSQTRLSERYRLVDDNTLELTAVVTDPSVLSRPWEMKYTYYRRANWDLQITTCIGTNREEPAAGEYKLNLTPPK